MSNIGFQSIDLDLARTAVRLAHQWTKSIGQPRELSQTLTDLTRTVHADVAVVSRKTAGNGHKKLIACHNASTGKVLPSSARSIADDHIGDELSFLRVGEMLRVSETLGLDEHTLLSRTGFFEIVVCILDLLMKQKINLDIQLNIEKIQYF